MSLHPSISAKVSYGKEGQTALTTVISQILGEEMTETKATFDTLDFESPTIFAELKRRTRDWTYLDKKIQEEGWLIPSCKIHRAWEELARGKRVFFFYFWSFDKSLWMFEMKSDDFSEGEKTHFIPRYHYDTQLHVAAHQSRWTRCEVDLSHLVFEEDLCWITD
jgi:hypothetical protein